MKRVKVMHGILLAMSLGISCQVVAQTSNNNVRALQQINYDELPSEREPGYESPTNPTQPTQPNQSPKTAISTTYNSTDIAANSKSNCISKDGRGDSTCFSAVGHTSVQGKPNTTPVTIQPFARPGLSCTTPWGQVIEDNSEVAAFKAAKGTYNYSTGSYAEDCEEEQRHCSNGVLSGSFRYQNCEIEPVNGRCGIANGAYYTYPTSGPTIKDQCNPSYTYGGVAPPDESPPSVPATSGAYLNTSNNMYYWSCAGEAGGGTATSCSAYRRIHGQCGSATNTCDIGGSYNAGSHNNYYPNYACSCSTNGSGVTTCSANPSGNQTCAGGYKDTTYTWNCSGINTGNPASCATNTYIPSNNIPPSPPCGASYHSESAACGTGFTGNQTRTNYVDNCTGNVISPGSWNRGSCVCAPTYSYGNESAACGAGYTGNQYRSTTTNSCTGGVTYGGWDRSSCTAVPTCPYAGQENKFCYMEPGGNEGCDTGTWVWGAEIYNNDAGCTSRIEERGRAYFSNCPGRQEYGYCANGY